MVEERTAIQRPSDELRQICQNNSKKRKNKEKVLQLLKMSGIDINEGDEEGMTPLILSCVNNHFEIIELLLNDVRINVNQRNNEGQTAFYIACKFGHTECVKMLLKDERIDINIPNYNGETPIVIANNWGHADVIRTIIASGKQINYAFERRSRRFKIHHEIEKLIGEFEINPKQTRILFRLQLGMTGTFLHLHLLFFEKKILKIVVFIFFKKIIS